MLRKIRGPAIVAALLAVALIASGCGDGKPAVSEPMPSTKQNDPPSPARPVEPVKWEEFEPLQAAVSRSQRFGSVYPAVLGVFADAEDLKTIARAFADAEKIDGQLDVAKPEYDLSFADEDGQTAFHLWLGTSPGNKGLFTYVEDTGTGYTISEENADKLRELIQALRYSPEQAIANGEIVDLHGKLTHADKWEAFVGQVRAGTPAEAHITAYTIEGAPVFEDLLFDGQAIQYVFDATKDPYGTADRTIMYCKNLGQDGTRYTLSKCGSEEANFLFDTAKRKN